MIFFLIFTPIQNWCNLMLQNIPHPPQKSQRTKSLTPQLEYMSVKSVICGYLAIRIRGQTFFVAGVLRCRIFSGLCSSTRNASKRFHNSGV